ncbi:MAG: ABC transporter permease, partial [Clostridiales bacterium]|nr:ABC transporter permease [Clostridiales bacterium]
YHDAFVETLKKNDTYTLKLAKYHEYTDAYTDSRGKTIYRGEQDLSPYGVSIDDIPSLRAQADGKADIYPSYTFNKNLHDFFDGFITEAQLRHNDFYASKFQEAIAVENFSTFHLPLLCGNLPTEPNEVLIYDYIAESLIYWELFSGEIKDLQGMTLTDNPSGFSMKVSGILKSGYAQYKDSSRYSYGFRSEYLDSLQSIYCFPEMIASIADDTEYLSVSRSGLNRIGYYIENPEDESDLPWYLTQDFPNTGIKKAKIISELPDCDITPNPYTGDGFNRVSYGVIVSKKQLKKILGNDVELTDEFLEELMTNYRFELGNRVYSMGDVSFWFGADYYIYGITDEDTYEDGALRVYITNPENDMFFYTPSGTFDGLYLSLSDNWNTNSEVLRNFELSVRATNFYEQNPDYDVTGYTNYSPAGILMRSADFYLKNVRDFAKNIILYVAIVAVLGIIFFTVNTIKKNTYKIGVLKTLGARNIDVTVIFGLETLFLSVVAFLISIGVSIFLMKGINYNFTKNIDPSLVFFSIGALDFLVTFLLSVTASVIAALAPLVKLYFTSPISIVKSNNRK